MIHLKQLVRDNALTQNALGEILAEPQSVISLLINSKRPLLDRHIEALINHFGADEIAKYTIPDDAYAPKQTTATFIPFEAIEEAKAEIIEAESIPMLPIEISNKVGCDIKAFIEENGDELEGINPSQLLNGADLAEKVLKASMMPTFVPDDIVFVTFLKDKYSIVDGDMYYFALKSKPTMIRKVKIEGNNIRLIAQNSTYGDIITTFDDVRNVAKIVGLLRMTFADFYSEMEEMRRQKEEQINKLIEQNKQSGERESRLISIIEQKHK